MLSSVDWALKIFEAEIGQMGSHKASDLNNIEVTDIHTGTAQAGGYIAIDATAKFKCVLF